MVAEIEHNGKNHLKDIEDMEVDELNGSRGDSGVLEDDEETVDEGEETVEEDEYIVEKILDHRKSKSGRIQYFLKWKGYGDSENTWENEDSVYCTGLVEEYWDSIGGRPYEKKKSKKPIATKGFTESIPSNPPPQTIKKRKPINEARSVNSDSDEEFPPAEWLDWEEHIEEVETVERDPDDGGILIYVNWKDGHRTVHPAKEVNLKCPQKIIRFYESHLRFKNVY